MLLTEPVGTGPQFDDLGAFIIYEEGDEEQLEHLVNFLMVYLKITAEELFDEKTRATQNDVYPPFFYMTEKKRTGITLANLIMHLRDPEKKSYEEVGAGFRYVDVVTFRAYKKMLDQEEGEEFAEIQEVYAETEDIFFPTKPFQH